MPWRSSAWISWRPASRSPPRATLPPISAICREVRGPRIASLARARREDIQAAARSVEEADRARIHIFLASSDIHLEHKLKIRRSEALDQVDAAVRLARTYVDDVEFSPEDATRSDPDFLCNMVAVAIDAGATRDQSARHRRLLRA